MSGAFYFSDAELACRCGQPPGNGPGHCEAPPMRGSFLLKLDTLRELWGHPLIVTSGVRCYYWNRHVGGAPASRHLLGDAADLRVTSREEALQLAALAAQAGMGGIGVADHFLHVDDGPRRRWTYPRRR